MLCWSSCSNCSLPLKEVQDNKDDEELIFAFAFTFVEMPKMTSYLPENQYEMCVNETERGFLYVWTLS